MDFSKLAYTTSGSKHKFNSEHLFSNANKHDPWHFVRENTAAYVLGKCIGMVIEMRFKAPCTHGRTRNFYSGHIQIFRDEIRGVADAFELLKRKNKKKKSKNGVQFWQRDAHSRCSGDARLTFRFTYTAVQAIPNLMQGNRTRSSGKTCKNVVRTASDCI